MNNSELKRMALTPRNISIATVRDPDLGDLKLLPGTWSNEGDLKGRGWNMIALPFFSPDFQFNYRLLLNQYNETLAFTIADKFVKNRGISTIPPATNTDQSLIALDYEQGIKQVMATDFPVSGISGPPDLPIHHEPGLWLLMAPVDDGRNDIGRLANIPHGNSLLALGVGNTYSGGPRYPLQLSGLPSGANQKMISDGYLAPYDYFEANPFKGDGSDTNFAGFNPKVPLGLTAQGIPGTPRQTTEIHVSTTVETGGILNIPFVVRQASASAMKSTFWIIELEETNAAGEPRMVLQYLQIVMLDFFERGDGLPGLARWPHISFNTMEKITPPLATKLTEFAIPSAK